MKGVVEVQKSSFTISVATFQDFLDKYLAENKESSVDYVHGTEAIDKHTTASEKNLGILLPGMEKGDLFKTVIFDGALPRKTFSMGHAIDKRFYFEARKIVQ